MAVSYNPSTGEFESGDLHSSAPPLPPAPAADTDEYRHHNEGRWVGTSELAQGTGIERTVRNGDSCFPVIDRPYRPTDRVDIPGIKGVTLAQAASLGFATLKPDGSFSFGSEAGSDRAQAVAGQPEGNQGNPEGEADKVPESLTFRTSDAAESAMTQLAEMVSPSMQVAAINALVETGEVGPQMIERMALQSGAEPADLARQVEAAHAGFYDTISARVEGMGVHDGDLFAEFVQGDSGMTRQMQKAVRDMMMHNDPTGFDGLAQRFVQSLDRVDPEAVTDALRASGIPHRRSSSGELALTLPGYGEISYREAVRQGAIKVSRA